MSRAMRASRSACWLAAVLIAGGCASGPHKTTEQRSKDRETVVAVQNSLNSNPNIYTRHVTIDADDGVVRLSGYVWSDFDMYEAQRLAAATPGVSRVVNDMELEREGLGDSPVSR